ncbi:MAG: FHA domain-containing protein, partial [Terriglobia bacterium]
MRVILETHSGPLSGNKVELKPGEQVRVGRTSKSDFAFPGDSRMSGIHFVVECSEHSCRVIDANSRNGIRLNGEKVSEKTLADGDQLVAGETRFLVRIEGNEPEDRLLAMLRGQFQPLYAVLDAAREPDVLKLLVESEAEYQSLFAGKDGAR